MSIRRTPLAALAAISFLSTAARGRPPATRDGVRLC